MADPIICDDCGEREIGGNDWLPDRCAICAQSARDYAEQHGIVCKHGVSESDDCADCGPTAWQLGCAACDQCDSLGPIHDEECPYFMEEERAHERAHAGVSDPDTCDRVHGCPYRP